MIYTLSLSLPSFRERNPDVGLRSGRFVKATVPRPQIHDHSNVSRCQSSCINIIRWPSFNYAAWRFAVHRYSPGNCIRCRSIQSGYYRTRCTRPDLSGHDESAFYETSTSLDIYKLIRFWWRDGSIRYVNKILSIIAIDQNFFLFLFRLEFISRELEKEKRRVC